MEKQVPPTHASDLPVPAGRADRSTGEAVDRVPRTATTSPLVLRTRARVGGTRLGYERHDLRAPAGDGPRASIVARRTVQDRQRRKRRIQLIVAAVVGIGFPPLLLVYLIAWLVWRNRPKPKSMRRVRQAVDAIEKDQTGIGLQRLQDAHLLDPSNNDALYWLGLLLADQQRYAEAIEALSLVSERLPGLPEVEAALLEAYQARGDHEAAIHHAQRLLDLDPYNLPALVKLAESFEAIGRADLAVETLQHAPLFKRPLDDTLKLIHYRLGELYEARGETERALQHYHHVGVADLAFMDVRDKIERLDPAQG